MTKEFSADRLDVKAFAQAKAHLASHDSLLKYKRLSQSAHKLHPDLYVDWSADGELRDRLGSSPQAWLHLKAEAAFPVVCQRCMQPMDVPLHVERLFRFVHDEATAEAQDGESEEDVLVLEPLFNAHELIEDELLMALPMVPMHDECPVQVKLESATQDFDPVAGEKANPFAALASLRLDKTKP